MIRTSDPLHPMQVRYQAALRPDVALVYDYYVSIFPSRTSITKLISFLRFSYSPVEILAALIFLVAPIEFFEFKVQPLQTFDFD